MVFFLHFLKTGCHGSIPRFSVITQGYNKKLSEGVLYLFAPLVIKWLKRVICERRMHVLCAYAFIFLFAGKSAALTGSFA